MLMANFVTKASNVHVVQKSTARDTSLFMCCTRLTLAGVHVGTRRAWKFVLLSVNLDNHFVKSHVRYNADLYSLVA